MTRTYTAQITPAQTIREERARYDALLERLGPPDRQAAVAFLTQRAEDQTPEEPADAELVARFRARFAIGANAATSPSVG